MIDVDEEINQITKYHDKKAQFIENDLRKEFTLQQQHEIANEIIVYIKEKEFFQYYVFMNDIAEIHPDWFNIIAFNKKFRKIILLFLNSNARARKTNR